MILAISSLSVGCRNIVLSLSYDSLKNVYVNILGFFFSFRYIEKLIVKDVSNIIEISYSIAIIKRERERVQFVYWMLEFLEK